MIGVSGLFYSSIRAQDIVGEDIKYTFGWSCVISWIATFLSFFTVILTLVLMCIYFDDITQRRNIVREELNMDNLSISSNELTRISRDSITESSIVNENNHATDAISDENDLSIGATNDLSIEATNDLSIKATDDLSIEETNDLSIEETNDLSINATDDLSIEATDDLSIKTIYR